MSLLHAMQKDQGVNLSAKGEGKMIVQESKQGKSICKPKGEILTKILLPSLLVIYLRKVI